MLEIHDDRIAIVSPGGVPKGITKENFGKRSIARNSIIANRLNISRQLISNNIKELKENNVIERVGANKKGYWKIL